MKINNNLPESEVKVSQEQTLPDSLGSTSSADSLRRKCVRQEPHSKIKIMADSSDESDSSKSSISSDASDHKHKNSDTDSDEEFL